MIHFFLTFSSDTTQSPFAKALREMGLEHRIFAGRVLLRYKHRIWLVLVGLPRMLRFSLASAWRSLVSAQPRPHAAVMGFHLQAMIFVLFGKFMLRRTVKIYLLGFIFTRRQNKLLDHLRQLYFNWLFSNLDGIFCHSSLEANRYDEIFPDAAGRFIFIPYGLHIFGYDEASAIVEADAGPALSAGRSARDYPLLTRVFAPRGWPLHIVCDRAQALVGTVEAPHINVLRSCYDGGYVRELNGAGMVVIPLSVDDISAGQMVAIQAMAFRKPIVITDTPTVREYLRHEHDALLVDPGCEDSLASAVERLRSDRELARRLADNAYTTYRNRNSMRALVQNIVEAINVSGTAPTLSAPK